MNALFRIGQEAVANVARHARPARVGVFAGVTQESRSGERFLLRIHDDPPFLVTGLLAVVPIGGWVTIADWKRS